VPENIFQMEIDDFTGRTFPVTGHRGSNHIQPMRTKETVKSWGACEQLPFPSVFCPPVILKIRDATHTGRKYLHENELARLDSYRLRKRRLEFFTGRICAKQAVSSYLRLNGLPSFSGKNTEIVTLKNGCPLVRFHPAGDFVAPHVSISHSKELAAAMASSCPCGIDLQKIDNKLLRVKEKFCSEQEQKLVSGSKTEDDPEALALLWCAKEAIQKRFGHDTMPVFSEIRLQKNARKKNSTCHWWRLEFSLPEKYHSGRVVAVAATAFAGYGLAITASTKEVNYAGTPGS
ncbi:4'-phosphopantetheinyl transferase family protein, partial [Desulfomarina sp.]